jgi:hypothetical protein
LDAYFNRGVNVMVWKLNRRKNWSFRLNIFKNQKIVFQENCDHNIVPRY